VIEQVSVPCRAQNRSHFSSYRLDRAGYDECSALGYYNLLFEPGLYRNHAMPFAQFGMMVCVASLSLRTTYSNPVAHEARLVVE